MENPQAQERANKTQVVNEAWDIQQGEILRLKGGKVASVFKRG